MSRREADFS